MSTDRFADMPGFAVAGEQLARAGVFLKKVPLSLWRTAAIILALIWVCNSIASVFWLLMPLPEQAVAPVVPAENKSQNLGSRTFDVKPLQVANLYGKYEIPKVKPVEVAKKPVVDNSEPAAETKLNIKLQGVIASSDPKASRAIIGEANSQELFKIGDKLPRVTGVTLAEVRKRSVIINNNGKREVLSLYDDKKNGIASTAPAPRRPTRPTRPIKKAGPVKKVVDAAEVRKAKSIGDVVRFMVATEGGKMIGYKVRPGRKRELFDQAGLKNDDIVISVNGIEVNEPQKVREVYQALKTATEANLEILRDGSTQSIQISMSGD